jgi:hypothetical protein
MSKKKVKDGLQNSKGITLKEDKVSAKPKEAKVAQLNPKAHNKDSLTENIQSRSSKSVKDTDLGKSKRVPLSQSLKSKKK